MASSSTNCATSFELQLLKLIRELTACNDDTAMDVRKKLNTAYCTPPMAASNTTTTSTSATNKDLAEYIPQYRSIIRGHKALHIAIAASENMEFVQNLLQEMNPNSLPSMVNNFGQNPLHYAAMVGNTAASKMLVEQNPHFPQKITFLYLLEVCKQHIQLSQQQGYHSPFEGRNGALLLTCVINQGILDNIIGKTDEEQDIENQETYKDNVVSACSRSCFHTVPHIKHLKEDKVKHNTALVLLRSICEGVGKTNRHSDMGDHYFKATNVAAVNDTPEAIEEMAIFTNAKGVTVVSGSREICGTQVTKEINTWPWMLFLSVTSLMVAFSAALYIVSGEENRWILIPIAALTCLPIASFVTLQFPLLVELVSSTYGRGIFGKQNDYEKART
ncbi:hypothetical protein L1987_76523 [Smallanthus sonchifolius]|uniref:Uncharacterized protein n=1 Tax=Smallanthus sonchifolius TaxID=185202 RepID=A0ACB8Z780_9ASTR|nr:hypothetical protein L1987_76523 [Smallanthus sonchifolius]